MFKDLISVPVARAACSTGSICPSGNVPSVDGTSDNLAGYITTITSNILQVGLVLAGALAVIYLLYMGIQYITSAGNPERAKVARAGVINAIIGIIIIISAFFLIRLGVSFGNSVACLDQVTCK